MTFELVPRWAWRLRLFVAPGVLLLASAAPSQVALTELTREISAVEHAVPAPNASPQSGPQGSPTNGTFPAKNQPDINWQSGSAQAPADSPLTKLIKPDAVAPSQKTQPGSATLPSALGLPNHPEGTQQVGSAAVPQWVSPVAIGFLGAGGVALLGWRLRRYDVRRARL